MLIPFLRAKLREFVRNESGDTAIEYGMIAGLIAVPLVLICRYLSLWIPIKFFSKRLEFVPNLILLMLHSHS